MPVSLMQPTLLAPSPMARALRIRVWLSAGMVGANAAMRDSVELWVWWAAEAAAVCGSTSRRPHHTPHSWTVARTWDDKRIGEGLGMLAYGRSPVWRLNSTCMFV